MSVDPADRTLTLVPRTPVPPAPVAPEPPRDALPIDDPDRYQLVAEHARGGLGRIVRAHDRRLGRTVAVKELLRNEDALEARFVREALITARLEHPGIVPVHEAGRWPNGAPYYAMKLVEGRTLKELYAETIEPRGRLALLGHVIAIADAVGYAHSQGVVHRDLKPSNVIVGAFGETVVIDWGLARDARLDRDEPEHPQVIGTPGYMAPEQARGEDVDERADVYAIGAILYELLGGVAPHAAAADATPRGVLDRVIAGPPRELHAVAPAAPAELVGIVAKAMARAPAERYANASALAEDLRRFQTGKLVSAHPYTPWQLVRKKLAQHRGVVAMAAASAIVLAAIGIESVRTIVAQRDIARSERARAESRERELVLVQAETSLRKDPTATLAWLKRAELASADVGAVVDTIDEAVALGVARHVFRTGAMVLDAQLTPDGTTVVAIVRDGSIRAYDLATGAARELGRTATPQLALAISADGSTAVSGGLLGEVIAWPLRGGGPTTLVDGGAPVSAVRVAASGGRVLVERQTGAIDVVTPGRAVDHADADATRVAVAADDWSRRAAVVAPNQVAAIADGKAHVVARTAREIEFVAVSPDARTIVVHDGEAVWTVPFCGGPLAKLAEYRGKVAAVAWSPDRTRVAIVGHLPEVLLVELTAPATVRELRGHTDAQYGAEFSRDGRRLITAGDDGTARVWNLDDGSSLALRGHDDDVFRAHLSLDGTLAATASVDGSVRVWPLARGGARELATRATIVGMELTGDRVLVTTPSSVASWDVVTGARRELFSWASDRRGLGSGLPSPDGERLVVPVDGTSLELRRRDAPPLALRGHTALVTHVEWSRDGDAVYTSSRDGAIRRWDAHTGAATIVVSGTVPIRDFGVAADGRIAAQIGEAAVLIGADGAREQLGTGPEWCAAMSHFDRVRDRLIARRCTGGLVLVDGKRRVDLPTDGFETTRIAASPDGTRIAGALEDRTVRVWEAGTGNVVRVLVGHGDLVMDVAFSPDGRRLASAGYDHTVRVWELASGRHRVLRGHAGPVVRVAWHGEEEIVTASEDGVVRVWPSPSLEPASVEEIAAVLERETTARIDARNRATTGG